MDLQAAQGLDPDGIRKERKVGLSLLLLIGAPQLDTTHPSGDDSMKLAAALIEAQSRVMSESGFVPHPTGKCRANAQMPVTNPARKRFHRPSLSPDQLTERAGRGDGRFYEVDQCWPLTTL